MTTLDTKDFVDYVYRNWKGAKKEAAILIEHLYEMSEKASVSELMQVFGEYYEMEQLADYANIWQYIISLYAIRHKILDMKPFYDDFMQSEHSSVISEEKDIANLPLEIQYALLYVIKDKNSFVNSLFYDQFCEFYPYIEAVHIMYLACLINEEKYEKALLIIDKLSNHFDEAAVRNRRIIAYAKTNDRRHLDGILNDLYNNFKIRKTAKNWEKVAFCMVNCLENSKDSLYFEKMYELVASYPKIKWNLKFADWYYFIYVSTIHLIPSEENVDVAKILANAVIFWDEIVRDGIDKESEAFCNICGHMIIETSKELSDKRLRIPFKIMLKEAESRKLLNQDGFDEIISSGYESLESYYFNDDERFDPVSREVFMNLYDMQDDTFEIMLDALLTCDENPGYDTIISKNYPELNKRLDEARRKMRNKRYLKTIYNDEYVMKPIVRTEKKVGRNDPCPCGSGKKYKRCCGKSV